MSAPLVAPLAEPHLPSARLLPAVWKLLRLRWQISWNSFRHARTRAKVGTVILYLFILIFCGAIFAASWMLLRFLNSPQLAEYLGDVSGLLRSIPALVLMGEFFFILLTSFGVLLQALYLSGDMDFLLVSPVPLRAVFVTKLLQAILPNFSLVALFGLPLLYGLGAASNYNFLYYLFVPLVMAAFSLAAAGISALLVMLVARVFPARRVVEVLGFLGAIFSMVCSQIGNLARFSNDVEISSGQTRGAFDMLLRFNSPWMPLAWAGRGLVELGGGQWVVGLLLLAVTLALAALIFGFALVTAERWYYTGWASMQVVANKKKKTPRANGPALPQTAALARLSHILPAPVRALIYKDLLVLRRDLRQLSQLVTPLILGVIYAFIFLRQGDRVPAGRGEAPEWFMLAFSSLWAYGNVLIAIFVSWSLISRLASMGFSQEGKNYWILKTAPLRPAHVLLAKFLVAYLPALGLGGIFLIAIALLQGIPLGILLYSLLALAMCLAGMDGISLGFGARGANFDWEDPRKMNAGNMGCLGMVLTALFVPISLGLFLGPLFVMPLLQQPDFLGYLLGGVAGSLVSLVIAILPLWWVQDKLDLLGEQ